MPIRKVVIPAAGRGVRLYPLTKAQPKEMLPLGRKPAIQWVAEEAVANGLDEILVVTGEKKRAVEDHLDDSPPVAGASPSDDALSMLGSGRASLFFTRQSVPRGLGDAVAQARLFCGSEPFAVALGDAVLMDQGRPAGLLGRMIRLFEQQQPAAVVAVREVPAERVSSYGVVQPAGEPGDSFPLADLVEKPAPEEAPSRLAITARYVFSPSIFNRLERTAPDLRGEVQLTDAIRLLLAEGEPVWAVRLAPGEVRYDVGSFREYARAFVAVALADPEMGEDLRAYLRELI